MLSQGLIQFLFIPKGRIKRLEFFLSNVLLSLFLFVLVTFIQKIANNNDIFIALFFLFLACLSAYVSIVLTIKRCHDVNLSGWFYFLYFVPLVNFIFILYLLFRASVDINNRY